MNNNYRYYAFISYSRDDSKYASWLQKKLENYHLPAVLQKQYQSLPKKLKIFRDVTDISVGGTVKEALNKELMDSKKLIILCSPSSAKSVWCQYEVQSFLNMGHTTDDIFPVIVKGQIQENSADDCYSDLLHNLNLNAVDIKKEGKYWGFIRLLSSLLGIKYDDLRNREKIRKNLYSTLICILLCFTAFSCYLFWTKTLKTSYKYFTDYTDVLGYPVGINELSAKEIKHKNEHYRFESRNGLLRRVVHSNSFGTPIEFKDSEFECRPMIQELVYNQDKVLISILSKDRNQKTLIENEFNKKYTRVNYKGDQTDFYSMPSSVTSLLNNEQSSYTQIRGVIYVRDSSGFIIKEMFRKYHNSNVPAKDKNGIYGYQYERNEFGQILSIHYLDKDETKMADGHGVAGKKYLYDSNSELIRVEYFGIDGLPVKNELGFMICEYKRDVYGNCIEESYLDGNNSPDFNVFTVNSGFLYSYNKNGLLISIQEKDEDGIPKEEIEHFSYDKLGLVNCEEYYDLAGNKISILNGIPKIIYQRDKRGNIIHQAYFDEEDEPVFVYNHYAAVDYSYDDAGNVTEIVYLDLANRPTTIIGGYAKEKYSYTESNKISQVSYLDENDHLVDIDNPFITISARIECDYDENDNCICISYYNADNLPVDVWGISKIKYDYDEQGNLLKTAYYNAEGKLADYNSDRAVRFGYSIKEKKYDEQGNCLEVSYFDNENVLIEVIEGDEVIEDQIINPEDLTYPGDEGEVSDGTFDFINSLEGQDFYDALQDYIVNLVNELEGQ